MQRDSVRHWELPGSYSFRGQEVRWGSMGSGPPLEDGWLPISQGRRLAEAIPGAAFHPVPGSGHLMQEDSPEAIVAHVLAFLAPGAMEARSGAAAT